MKKLFILLIAATALASCGNDGVIKPTALTSINVTNAIIGGSPLTINASMQTVYPNGFAQFSFIAGQTKVDLFSANEPSYAYYKNTIPTVNGSYYSLFLTGTDSAHVQSVLVKETYTNYADSVAGVRFVNLSPGSSPISVDIAGNANGSEVSSLAYLSYSTFKKYASDAAGISYNFEFRDAGTGTLITTYNINVPIFRNVTLVLAGTENNPVVIQDNDF